VDTKKFVLLVSALTAIVCALTIVYNFAAMPAYGDTAVSAVPLYIAQSSDSTGGADSQPGSSGVSASSAVPVVSSAGSSSAATVVQSSAPVTSSGVTSSSVTSSSVTSSKVTTHKTESKKTATAQNPVNLNTATVAELETVPYIGEKKAKAIVDYRSAHGPFSSVDALDSVKGFGKKTIAKLRPYLTA
jgi:competence protein ComEA